MLCSNASFIVVAATVAVLTVVVALIFTDQQHGFSSVQSFDRLERRKDVMNDSAEIIFQSFLPEALCKQFWHGKRHGEKMIKLILILALFQFR